MSFFGIAIAGAGGAVVWLGYKLREPTLVAGGTALAGIGGAVAL